MSRSIQFTYNREEDSYQVVLDPMPAISEEECKRRVEAEGREVAEELKNNIIHTIQHREVDRLIATRYGTDQPNPKE